MIMVLCKMTKDRENILVETFHFPVNHHKSDSRKHHLMETIPPWKVWWNWSDFFFQLEREHFLRIALHLRCHVTFWEVDSKPPNTKGPIFSFGGVNLSRNPPPRLPWCPMHWCDFQEVVGAFWSLLAALALVVSVYRPTRTFWSKGGELLRKHNFLKGFWGKSELICFRIYELSLKIEVFVLLTFFGWYLIHIHSIFIPYSMYVRVTCFFYENKYIACQSSRMAHGQMVPWQWHLCQVGELNFHWLRLGLHARTVIWPCNFKHRKYKIHGSHFNIHVWYMYGLFSYIWVGF